ncbi:MAG: YdaS family helix-turn-helix protein [Pseudomonadota bacterium]
MAEQLTPFEALELAVEQARTQERFANALGVSQPTVWRWLQSSKRIPAEHVLEAERQFGVSRHDLRPDIYPRNYPPAPETRFHGVDRHARRVA